ncbi:MAG TPA: CPBP family intramembrane metalloprotease domain-containing protein [Actinobacteria bacterium]|jgi:membrane protease YdiL (CAAX protease family)|nr:CPBP family intramembrane metalloprotease domain-containing protein [Actinomycetota bacterium]
MTQPLPSVAAPAPLPAFPHATPTPYHLMLRTWTYAWWRPVVGMLLVLFGFLIAAPVAMLPVVAVAALFEKGPWTQNFSDTMTLKRVDAGALLYLNLTLASMILVTWLVMRVLHNMRPRWLASVRPRLRWKFLFACLGLSVIALGASILVGSFLPGGSDEGGTGHLNHFTVASMLVAVVVMLTTPLQAAGEEYAFRGYLMQAIGSLSRSRWLAIVATATVFALAHGVQNPPLFFDRFAFGFIAGWLVTYTGGLEAGIALHVLNNILAFGIALAFGDLATTVKVEQVSWWNIVNTVTQSGVYTVLVVLVARKMGLRNTTAPPGS